MTQMIAPVAEAPMEQQRDAFVDRILQSATGTFDTFAIYMFLYELGQELLPAIPDVQARL